ncbi:GLPGLI family protein [Psychroflexus salis]|uniref:GLPGLI family protein n=1 Tax=Psychroflexus salis TaxID=1526574 RepID=A0A917ECW1_9FLAO|nr:GLPGLI family protein [Psychroflexus salis]GGE23212.1 hypothetical protein GCM10010831_25120 [Psychroflexus salis]
MFKKKLRFFIIIFIVSYSVYSQNKKGEIMYGQRVEKMYIDTTSIDNSDLKSIMVELFEEKQKLLSSDESYYSLKFNEGKSVFTTLNFMNNDKNKVLNNKLVKGTYFINILDNSIYHKGNFMGEDLIIFYDKQPYEDWKITDEKKVILGYNCIKAETIRQNEKGVKTKVTAWFTTDINLNYGPKNYFGLPGLIIELHELDSVYYVQKIKFKNVTLDKIDPNDKKIITYQDYVKKVNGSIRF